MESILFDFEYPSGDMDTFPLVDIMDTSSLLDDCDLISLKKIQGDYNTDSVQLHDADQGLFPDLLSLEHDTDPLAMDWMENVDFSHLLDKNAVPEVKEETSPVGCDLPITVQPEDIDLLQSLLQDTNDQLTPPSSPPAQVAPEIDLTDVTFNHQAAWEIINSPLSPQDVENLLSPSPSTISSVSLTPPVSNPPSPGQSPVELPTIDISSICSDQTVGHKVKGRPKPYERTCRRRAAGVVRKLVEDDSDPDFSFRANEKLSKRERKKLQNKNAATKYRQKKKLESNVILSEEKDLEDKNAALKDKVEQLTREISCMKEVLGDIYKGLEAKGKR